MMSQVQKGIESINLIEVMSGLEHFFSPNGITEFTVTQKCQGGEQNLEVADVLYHREVSQGQVSWLNGQLYKWKELLEKYADLIVNEIRVVDDNFGCSIVVNLSIPGRIKAGEIANSDISKELSGQIKKALAMKVLERFPPPFDTQNPLWRKGYVFFLVRGWRCESMTKEELLVFWDQDRQAQLAKTLCEHKLELFSTSVKTCGHDVMDGGRFHFRNPIIKTYLLEDCHLRRQIGFDLRDALLKFGREFNFYFLRWQDPSASSR